MLGCLDSPPCLGFVCQSPSGPGQDAPAPHHRPRSWRSAGLPAEGPCPALVEVPASTIIDVISFPRQQGCPVAHRQAIHDIRAGSAAVSTQWTSQWLWAQRKHIAGKRRDQGGERANLFLFNIGVGRYHCRPLNRPLLLRWGRRHLCMSWRYAQKTMG